jgi:hypothetical protein
LSAEEQDLLDWLTKSKGRPLTSQEAFFSLEQAFALGVIGTWIPGIGWAPSWG